MSKKKEKKDRMLGLQFSLDGIPKEELETLKVAYRFTNNGLEFDIRTDNRAIQTSSFKGYQRHQKPGFNLKLSSQVTDTNQTEIIPNLKRFDSLFAIDTNSFSIPKIKRDLHIGAAFQLVSTIDESRAEEVIELVKIFVAHGSCEKPENHNWRNLINLIRDSRSYLVNRSYGIIVDSDLGNLTEFNKREMPILDDFFLPVNFQLIYASSDLKNDGLANQMIFECHKLADILLKEIRSKIEEDF